MVIKVVDRFACGLFIVRFGVVGVVVAADRFFQCAALFDDQVGHGDHVAQFAQLAVGLDLVVQLFGLFVDDRQAAQGAFEREIRADDADVVGIM